MISLKNDSEIFALLFGLVAFTMPFGLLANSNPIAIILLTAFTFFKILKNQTYVSFKKSQVQWLPLIFFVYIAAVTLICTEDLPKGLKDIEKTLSFLIFPILLVILQKHLKKQFTDKIFAYFVFGNLTTLFFCFLFAVYDYYVFSNTDPLFKGSFYFTERLDIHPTYFSMYIALCIAFIRTFINQNKSVLKSNKKRMLNALVFLFFISILHLRSRSGLLAVILIEAVFLAAVLSRKLNRTNRKYFWLLFGVFISSILYIGSTNEFYDYSNKFFKRDSNAAIEDRLKNWEASVKGISEAPMFGNGLVNSSIVRDKFFYVNGYDTGIDNSYNSHNQFIETTLVSGFVGLGILLMMLFSLFNRFVKKGYLPVICFFIILLTIMMTESILVRQQGIVFFSFFYVLFNAKFK